MPRTPSSASTFACLRSAPVCARLPSCLQLVTEAPHRHEVSRFRRIGFDLRAQTPDVRVDEPAVTEVVVSPHALEQLLAAQDHARMRGELAQQAELRLGQLRQLAADAHLARAGLDLELAEDVTI